MLLPSDAQAQITGLSKLPKQASAAQRNAGVPRLTLFGGSATSKGGRNNWDMGPALAASLSWKIPGAPFRARFDPYFEHHSGAGVDA